MEVFVENVEAANPPDMSEPLASVPRDAPVSVPVDLPPADLPVDAGDLSVDESPAQHAAEVAQSVREIGVVRVELAGLRSLGATAGGTVAMRAVGFFQAAVSNGITRYGGDILRVDPGIAIARFPRPADTVHFALAIHAYLRNAPREIRLAARIGIDVSRTLTSLPSSRAKQAVAALTAAARPHQTLVSRAAFRQVYLDSTVITSREPCKPSAENPRRWLTHIHYPSPADTLAGSTRRRPLAIYEVGIDGVGPFTEPRWETILQMIDQRKLSKLVPCAGVRVVPRLVAIAFTDIVDSSALARTLGPDLYRQLRQAHDRIGRQVIAQYAGQLIKSAGDSFLVSFATASDAVRFALAFQHRLRLEPWETYGRCKPLQIRVGLNLGEVDFEHDHRLGKVDVFSSTVNDASRVLDAALPGQILMTSAVAHEARQFVRAHPTFAGRPPGKLRFMDHGDWYFKGGLDPIQNTALRYRLHEIGLDPRTTMNFQGAPFRPPLETVKATRATAHRLTLMPPAALLKALRLKSA